MVLLRLQFIFFMKCEVRSLVWESGRETAGGLRMKKVYKSCLSPEQDCDFTQEVQWGGWQY